VIPASRDPGGPESWWRSGRFFNRELGEIGEDGNKEFIPELPELPVDSGQECSVIPASRDPGGPESWWRSGRFFNRELGEIGEDGNKEFIPELPELPVDSGQECSVIPASRDPGGPESWWRSGRFFNRELGEFGEEDGSDHAWRPRPRADGRMRSRRAGSATEFDEVAGGDQPVTDVLGSTSQDSQQACRAHAPVSGKARSAGPRRTTRVTPSLISQSSLLNKLPTSNRTHPSLRRSQSRASRSRGAYSLLRQPRPPHVHVREDR
jgi:hypothetical protein